MTPIPISRYSPGGDIYAQIAAESGQAGAQKVYLAALTGDRTSLANARRSLKGLPPIAASTPSTASEFFDQITTDPLAAPLAAANNQLGKAVLNVLKNPWVLLAVGVIIFWQLGGFNWAKRKLGNA
jgi:hypothetical protein